VYRPVSRQRPRNKRHDNSRCWQQILNKQQFNYNNRETVGKGVFYSISAMGLYKEDTSLGAQLPVENL
jgi:hypothetical protein